MPGKRRQKPGQGDVTLLSSMGTSLFCRDCQGLWLADVQASKCWQRSMAGTGAAQASQRSFSHWQEWCYHPKLSFSSQGQLSRCDITDSMDMHLSKLWGMLKDGEGWCATVHGDAKNWTQLSDWTTTKWVLEDIERRDISSTCSWYCLLLKKSGSLWLVVKTGRGFTEFRGRSHHLRTAVEKLLQHMNSGRRIW